MTAQCEIHGDFQGVQRFLLGRTYAPACPTCREETRKQEAQDRRKEEKALRAERLRRRLAHADIPSRFENRSLENYRAEMEGQKRALKIAVAYAERFRERVEAGGGLLLCGKPGTGKTHLATAIMRHVLVQHGYRALYTTTLRAIRRVKETYRRDAEVTEQQVIDSFTDYGLLVVDEVGVQLGTETEKLILFEILNGRYSEMLPTILISNLPEGEITEYLGTRVIDRLKEGGGAVVAFDWESYRGRVARDPALNR